MADVRIFAPTKDTSVRRVKSNGVWGGDRQAKGEQHLIGGYANSGLQYFQSLIQFSPVWTDIDTVVKAELVLWTRNDHAGMLSAATGTTHLNIRVAPKLEAWVEAGGNEADWDGAIGAITDTSSYDVYRRIDESPNSENRLDITTALKYIAPTTVKFPNAARGLGHTNYGFTLKMADAREWVVASKNHVDPDYRPTLQLTVVAKGGPGLLTPLAPVGAVPAAGDVLLEARYDPGRSGDYIATVDLNVREKVGAKQVWAPVGLAVTPNDVTTGTFHIPIPKSVVLRPGVNYEWNARVKNQRGETTPVSAFLTFSVTTAAPSLANPTPQLTATTGTYANLNGVRFGAVYSDPTNDFPTFAEVQVRDRTPSFDPVWADTTLFWDSGPMPAPASTTGSPTTRLDYLYQGSALQPGAYSWRMRAFDQFGVPSPWVYGDFDLTLGYQPQPGDTDLLTGYARRRDRFRVRIFKMGALRGPGTLVAELTDAANVGARENFNAPGEFFFTLPATHPQVAVIEPFQTHFELAIYRAEGWYPVLSGLMTDFDATEDEVVFYGTDYIGVLNMVQDERYDPTKPDLPTTDGGAKYVDRTISQVVVDQLTQAKAQPNSPVGFITVGDVAAMPERLTIHASFKNRLAFVSGLLDSSRAGTGRKTRIVCERSATGTFKWRVLFAPGKARDNLRFEYGGLVQGFQTIPYQGWATRVDAVGRTVSGAKTFFHKAIAPGVDESVWGAFPVSTVFQDLADLNDLRRRAAQLASGVSKQGKALRFGIRVGAFDIKDGWDITDDIPVRIKRGVVDTSRYGSGYWTIWGWVWQSYPDGHSDLDLVIGPREDATPLNPDLIPSLPIFSTDQQWQVGYGKPTSYGQPPIPTPTP